MNISSISLSAWALMGWPDTYAIVDKFEILKFTFRLRRQPVPRGQEHPLGDRGPPPALRLLQVRRGAGQALCRGGHQRDRQGPVRLQGSPVIKVYYQTTRAGHLRAQVRNYPTFWMCKQVLYIVILGEQLSK